MPFRPTVDFRITISGKEYCFMEHPAAKGMPYGQSGRRGTVYQVQTSDGVLHALKVFTKAFRTPLTEQSAQRIADFAHLPGLQVCRRDVLNHTNNPDLLTKYPDLEYAVLMPWVQGQTWQEMILNRQPLTPQQSLTLARQFADILATMEANSLAHCDLSGPNVMVDQHGDTFDVALVDVEDLYAPGLQQPDKLPGGSAGYGHKTAQSGLWSANADRFAGAVLLAEMLGWADARVRRIAVGEQYFDINELQKSCDRYQILSEALHAQPPGASDLLPRAWYSKHLYQCPTLKDWQEILGEDPSINDDTVTTTTQLSTPPQPPTAEFSATEDALAAATERMQNTLQQAFEQTQITSTELAEHEGFQDLAAQQQAQEAQPEINPPSDSISQPTPPFEPIFTDRPRKIAVPSQHSAPAPPVQQRSLAPWVVLLIILGVIGAVWVGSSIQQANQQNAESTQIAYWRTQNAIAQRETEQVQQQSIVIATQQAKDSIKNELRSWKSEFPYLYATNFSQSEEWWYEGDDSSEWRTGQNYIADGKYYYQIQEVKISHITWSFLPTPNVSDFYISTEFTKYQSESAACYGLFFLWTRNDNNEYTEDTYYALEICPRDQSFYVWRNINDSRADVLSWQTSDAISTTNANNVELGCKNHQCIIVVNNQFLGSFYDDSISEGDVLLFISINEGEVLTHISFDDIEYYGR